MTDDARPTRLIGGLLLANALCGHMNALRDTLGERGSRRLGETMHEHGISDRSGASRQPRGFSLRDDVEADFYGIEPGRLPPFFELGDFLMPFEALSKETVADIHAMLDELRQLHASDPLVFENVVGFVAQAISDANDRSRVY